MDLTASTYEGCLIAADALAHLRESGWDLTRVEA